jgi:hypothetical protein
VAAQARFGRTRNELVNYADNLDRLASLAEHRSQVTSERFAPLSDGSVRIRGTASPAHARAPVNTHLSVRLRLPRYQEFLTRERVAGIGQAARQLLLGPSHFVGFHGMAAGSERAGITPLGTVLIDRPVVERLIEARPIGVLDAAHAREHSLEVQLPFLQAALSEFALVPIVAGDAFGVELAVICGKDV